MATNIPLSVSQPTNVQPRNAAEENPAGDVVKELVTDKLLEAAGLPSAVGIVGEFMDIMGDSSGQRQMPDLAGAVPFSKAAITGCAGDMMKPMGHAEPEPAKQKPKA